MPGERLCPLRVIQCGRLARLGEPSLIAAPPHRRDECSATVDDEFVVRELLENVVVRALDDAAVLRRAVHDGLQRLRVNFRSHDEQWHALLRLKLEQHLLGDP
jgi:hypothetical protein